MKNLILALGITVSAVGFASTEPSRTFACSQETDSFLETEFESNSWSYFGIEEIRDNDQLNYLLEENSTELTSELKTRIRELFSDRSLEWYEATGTGEMSGGFQELIAVRTLGCKIEHRFTHYIE